ncbi:cytochrome o ubiquinol oxidase subunit IV [Candidatus Neptunichlamydia sp. REUL1]|uniref:cytochrome o ubiquinol oxidase subunit IV n=1 Tax=Candidatus Neptunichlamydia sp. REUL1 TaxID=3064277 RepID=UPI00292E90C0|nr:SemiSWEET family transporter [Candidatus Neptunochlamydia sp. REUL1]
MIDEHHGWNLSFKPLWIGFVISLVLVASAYRIVAYGHLKHDTLMLSIIMIGCVLALIQLIFFLHLGLEEKPRWNLIMFIFGVALMFILIGGTIWIMNNLNYNAMPRMGH